MKPWFYLIAMFLMSATAAQQKNILFIAVDDLKPAIGAYGDEIAVTPNIDSLAKEGTIFTNAHTQQAVCAPSRASLLTGLRPDLTEVWDLNTQIRNRNPSILTLPQYFKNKGYVTIGMGKIFDHRSVDRRSDARSWSRPYIRPKVNHPQFGKPIIGFQSSENKEILEVIRNEALANGIPPRKMHRHLRGKYKPSTECIDISDDGYLDGAMTDRAIEEINVLAGREEPFFLAIGFHKPHLPFVAPKKYWDFYKREEMPLPVYQKHARNSPKYAYHPSGELKSYSDIPEAIQADGLLKLEKQQEIIHGYYASVSYVDAQIGKLIKTLRDQKLASNTIIILWGDHGWHLGDHGLWNKHSNFEQATRSPLIIVDPSIDQAVDSNHSPVEFVDVFPTLCDLTELKIPSMLQGKSLKSLLNESKDKVKGFALSQYPRNGVMGYALRDENYRYVAWYKSKSKRHEHNIVATELYDYRVDPLETENKADMKPKVAALYQTKLNLILSKQSEQIDEFKSTQHMDWVISNNLGPDSLGNFVRNPGFEEGGLWWKTVGSGVVDFEVGDSKTGDRSMEFTGTMCTVIQDIAGLTPGTTYELSGWIKSENDEKATLKARFYGGKDIILSYTESGYGKVSTQFTTGPDHTSVRIALIKHHPKAKARTWFDEIILKQVEE